MNPVKVGELPALAFESETTPSQARKREGVESGRRGPACISVQKVKAHSRPRTAEQALKDEVVRKSLDESRVGSIPTSRTSTNAESPLLEGFCISCCQKDVFSIQRVALCSSAGSWARSYDVCNVPGNFPAKS